MHSGANLAKPGPAAGSQSLPDLACFLVFIGIGFKFGPSPAIHLLESSHVAVENVARSVSKLMTWEQVGAEWERRKSAASEQWAELTGSDLDFIAGRRDRLVATLRRRYGISTAQAQKRVDWWLQTLDHAAGEPRQRLAHM